MNYSHGYLYDKKLISVVISMPYLDYIALPES